MNNYLDNIQQALAQIEQLTITPADMDANLEAVQSLYTYILNQFKMWAASGGMSSVDTIDGIITVLNAHLSNLSNPHQVTAAQVGLGNVANLAPADLPMSDATKTYVDGLSFDMSAHIADTNNPHDVTANQIGFVFDWTTTPPTVTFTDPTTSANTIALATQPSLDTTNTNLSNHISNQLNPHNVTAVQVGLGNVQNLAPADLPVSTATNTAISNVATTAQTNLTAHTTDTNNPHQVTAAQLGLGNYPGDPNDLPYNNATQIVVAALQTLVNNHIANTSNPHTVTAGQIGLGNVANLAPADLPISSAQAAVNAGVSSDITNLQGQQTTNTTNITSLLSRVGINENDIAYLKYFIQNTGLGSLGFGGIYATTGDVTTPVDGTLYLIGTSPSFTLQIYYNSTWYVVIADISFDINNYVLVTDFNNAINSINNQLPQITTNTNSINALSATVTSHTSDVSNPHQVTAAQVGLGNVSNTAPADLPISNATQAALTALENSMPDVSGLAPINNPTFTGTVTLPANNQGAVLSSTDSLNLRPNVMMGNNNLGTITFVNGIQGGNTDPRQIGLARANYFSFTMSDAWAPATLNQGNLFTVITLPTQFGYAGTSVFSRSILLSSMGNGTQGRVGDFWLVASSQNSPGTVSRPLASRLVVDDFSGDPNVEQANQVVSLAEQTDTYFTLRNVCSQGVNTFDLRVDNTGLLNFRQGTVSNPGQWGAGTKINPSPTEVLLNGFSAGGVTVSNALYKITEVNGTAFNELRVNLKWGAVPESLSIEYPTEWANVLNTPLGSKYVVGYLDDIRIQIGQGNIYFTYPLPATQAVDSQVVFYWS